MKYRVLELFCGTKSIGKHCAQHSSIYEVVSVDIDRKCKPDIVTDILEWNYQTFAPHTFDIIWASPPCTHFSILRTTGSPRDIEGANQIVKRTLEIIAYFQPHVWFMENPASGYLKVQQYMNEIPYVDVHYCKYDYPYRKWTRIWTNIADRLELQLCRMDCAALIFDTYTGTFRHRGTFGGNYPGVPLHQRYSIPPGLVHDLFESAAKYLCEKDVLIETAKYIMVGGSRPPISIRSVNVHDPTDIVEYASISEAAKAIEGETTFRNVRAALTRHLTKGTPLCDRIWTSLSTQGQDAVVPPSIPDNVVPKHVQHEMVRVDSVNAAEIQYKTKQTELLTRYLEMFAHITDPSVHVLVKKYLM